MKRRKLLYTSLAGFATGGGAAEKTSANAGLIVSLFTGEQGVSLNKGFDFSIKISNNTKSTVRFQNRYTNREMCVLKFMYKNGAFAQFSFKNLQGHTGPLSGLQSVADGESILWRYEVADWEWLGPLKIGDGESSDVIACINILPTWRDKQDSVWSGSLESKVTKIPWVLKEVFPVRVDRAP